MPRTLLLLSLTLVVESINDLAWYSPVTRSVPIDLQPLSAKADLCSLPPDIGGCSKELIRYYYDSTADECKRFIFSGCGGNSNRFMRRTHCRSRCLQKKANTDNFLKESKHRRTLTTTVTPSTVQTNPTTTTVAATTLAAVTRPVQKINKTKITPSIRECPHCDPIYGVCVDGDCGCIPGFKKLGRICIDINECASENICPFNSRCVNTIGSYRCDCDSGFTKNGECLVTKDACTDVFDINLTEEDCNNGEQLIRYYFDHDSLRCKQFFYGGCKSTSRNIFSDVQTCDELCASIPREELKIVSFGDLAEQKEIVNEIPMKLNLDIKSDTETTTVPIEIQQQEVDKIEKIMKDITPNENVCLRDFDEVLRLECVTADWNEKFFWNYEMRECEPFWYDISCDLRDKAGKNFFESLETCQKTCHEETETVHVVEPSKKVIEFPPFHPSIENPQVEEHPLTRLSYAQKDTSVADETTVTTTNYIDSTSVPLEQKFGDVSEETFHLQHRLQYPLPSEESQTLATDEMEEYDSEEVTKPPIYRHPLEDIPIEEDVPPKPSRKLKKKVKLPISGNIVSMTTSTKFPEYFATEAVTTQPIELTTAELLPETTPFIKIITLPTTVRLAPGPRMDPSSLVTKSAPLSKFDRQQYMLEFKKKLMALPDDAATSMSEPQFVLKSASSKPKRPLFTLPPSVFEEPTTALPTPAVTHRHRLHHHRDSNDILSTQRDLPTTVEPDFVSKEKTKVETTLKELKQMNDLCEEPLHPRLEEDCSNENWVIRWYFNTDRGTCKSFWYGGCDSEARNFFPTIYSCKTACAHKYPVGEQKPNYVVPAVNGHTTTESSPTSNLGDVVEIPKVIEEKSTEHVEPLQKNEREAETGEVELNTQEESAPARKLAEDPCDDGYDEKWDEDCANDDWQVRSYYDQAKKGCKKFWWGGCLTGNRNLWKNQQDCEKHCGHKTDEEKSEPEAPMEDIDTMPTLEVTSNAGTTEESVLAKQAFQADLSRKLAVIKRTEEGRKDLAYSKAVDHPVTIASECLDPFDKALEKTCSGGLRWKNRYYYDPDSRECKMFWNDGCFSTSRNNFEDIESCLWKCVGKHPEASGRGCLEKFDEVYLGDCRHGEFSTRFYFDHQTKKCSAFHWGGCQSSNLNFYLDSGECADTCERPPRELTRLSISS
ncbi:unnamed protein product [Auanema sp. JU1783]|nr:unnamed protein product [Auanema sp. JU1783]